MWNGTKSSSQKIGGHLAKEVRFTALHTMRQLIMSLDWSEMHSYTYPAVSQHQKADACVLREARSESLPGASPGQLWGMKLS